MAIQINLLAESHALEDLRRRDPVKRIILGGVVAVMMILAWSSSLFFQTILTKSELSNLESDLGSKTNEYAQIISNLKALDDDRIKLISLHQLATNRFLVGTFLNGLQQATLDNIQLVRLKLNQSYIVTEAAKLRANSSRSKSKPATATEKISLTLNARDSSKVAGDAVDKFKNALTKDSYFAQALGKQDEFRLGTLGQPSTDPDGNVFVLFTLDANFPDKTR